MEEKEKMEELFCWDCKKEIKDIKIDEKNQKVTGAKFYDTGKSGMFVKCLDCYAKDKVLRNFQDSLCYSRVVGFLTSVNGWNDGKKAEWEQRKEFSTNKALNN